jgi:methyl-accepting chemotaxis protein
MRNRSLRFKLYGSFAIVLALLALIAGTAFWSTANMSGSSGRVVTATATEQAAQNVEGLAFYIHESQTRFVLNHGTSFPDHAGDVKTFEAALAVLKARSTTPADRAALARVDRAFAVIQAMDQRLLRLVRTGHFAAAVALVNSSADHDSDALAGAAGDYHQLALAQEDAAVRSFDSTMTLSRWVIGVSTVLAFVVAAMLAFLLTRQITSNLAPVLERLQSLRDRCAANLRGGLQAMAGGDLTWPVELETPEIEHCSGDEIGQAAAAVNGIRDATAGSIEAYNTMRAELDRLIGEVAGVSRTITSTAGEMATTAEEASRAVEQTSASIGQMAVGAERQARMIEQATDRPHRRSRPRMRPPSSRGRVKPRPPTPAKRCAR